MAREIPEACKRGDHEYTYGRCDGCGADRPEPTSRRTGGAGSLTAPLSDEDYRTEMRKLQRLAGAE